MIVDTALMLLTALSLSTGAHSTEIGPLDGK
jgi:hypothetical protein